MPRKKAMTDEKEKLVGLTVRLSEQDSRLFNALLSLRGESANDVLKKTALSYIQKYKHLLNMNEVMDQMEKTPDVKSPIAAFRKTNESKSEEPKPSEE